jgi:hypothetical protein
MRLLAIALCLCLLATAASAQILVKKAYYRDTNASLHLFVTNKGDKPVTLLAPVVDGFDTATLGRTGLKAGPVLWYRCRPNVIPAGGIADVVITLAEPATKPVAVEIKTASGESVKATIQCAAEALRFQAIRFGPDLRWVDVYARWSDGSSSDALKTILMDGRIVGRFAAAASTGSACSGLGGSAGSAASTSSACSGLGASIGSGASTGSACSGRARDGLAYTRITLDKPLAKGSFHIFEAETESGLSTAYQIRAIPAEFLIGVYGSPSKANILDWAAHGCNYYLSFGAVAPDLLGEMNAAGLSVGAKYIPQPLVDRAKGVVVVLNQVQDDEARRILEGFVGKPGLLYHHLVDEPDAADYYAGKRLGASSMELVARGELCAEVDPQRYTFVQLDNTFRPRNYRVYGEAADVVATHRYSLGSQIGGEAGSTKVTRLLFLEDLQDTMVRFREANEPKPFFMVTQFFDIGPGRQGRPPTIEEMRLQCYIMVAGGARGLIHYIHSGSGGGHEGAKTPALWDAMTAMHQELKRVGEIAESGTVAPQSWVKSGSANVWASALLCGDKIAIIAVNRAHRSALDRFTAKPMRDVKISMRVPAWIDASKLEVIAADGSQVVPSTLQGDELSFTVREIKDAGCYMLVPRAGRGDRILRKGIAWSIISVVESQEDHHEYHRNLRESAGAAEHHTQARGARA